MLTSSLRAKLPVSLYWAPLAEKALKRVRYSRLPCCFLQCCSAHYSEIADQAVWEACWTLKMSKYPFFFGPRPLSWSDWVPHYLAPVVKITTHRRCQILHQALTSRAHLWRPGSTTRVITFPPIRVSFAVIFRSIDMIRISRFDSRLLRAEKKASICFGAAVKARSPNIEGCGLNPVALPWEEPSHI